MPIGDLLAEISGEATTPAPLNEKTSTSAGFKRRADSELNNGVRTKKPKAQHADISYSNSSVNRNAGGDVVRQSLSVSRNVAPRKPSPAANRPSSTSRPPTNGPRSFTASSSSLNDRPYTGSSNGRTNGRPSPLPSSLKKDTSDFASRSKPSVAPAKPSPVTPYIPDSGKAPKKGSFAEIMARAQKAQQIMPKPGFIQHKAIEKPLSKRERMDQKLGKGKFSAKETVKTGTVLIGSRNGPRASGISREDGKNSGSRDAKSNGKSRPNSSGSDVQEKEKEKKLKKAAAATTGYTGTARPPPEKKKPSTSRNGASAASSRTAGGLLAPPTRHSRYDDEDDEELDDFIVDDEDDQPQPRGNGHRYDYDSDGSSDMEAGITDIDMEESKAARLAREEDRREEMMLEKLKREKEERKRRFGGR